jgi:hypothetical protein
MDKIPVGQTISLAYRFLFTEIGTILGICWFPALLSSLASYFTAIYAAMHRADIQAGDPRIVAAYAIVSVLGLSITIFAASVMAVALTRHVLGRRVTGVVAYFAVGPVEWRMFTASIRYIAGAAVLVVIAVILSGVAFRIAGVPVDAAGPMNATAPDIIAGLISWLVFIAAFVVIVRVGFFIPPTIVAEDKGGLRRSFELTQGNVLRALAVIAVLGIPVLLLLLGGEAVVLRSALGPALYGMSPTEFFQRAGEAMEQKLLPWEVFTGVIFVLGSALIYGGAAMAYRARIGNPDLRPPR